MTAVTLDDFLVVASHPDQMEAFNSMLTSKYKIKRLYKPSSYLNWNVQHYPDGSIHISQPQPIQALLDKYQMNDANIRSTPLPHKANFDLTTTPLPPHQRKEYESIIGSLRYLADSTRLDIAYAIGKLAQFTHQPQRHHFEMLKHVLRYLKGTKDHGILYSASPQDQVLETYSDADYASAKDRHSQEGYLHTAFG